ncbi:uncharacterized protein LOC133788441 [Humulus lupulus]|uniref:uncharacterized protein LOC133788441 n=1 Tax=Humulus lupulus TaxID=3486 RepID=UPI002B40D3F8|nr:uncharacterized protein LOC133788441 [Humulus lupulus]
MSLVFFYHSHIFSVTKFRLRSPPSMASTHIFESPVSISISSSSTFHRSPLKPSPLFSPITQTPSSSFKPINPPRIQIHGNPSPSISRRSFLPPVSGIWEAITGGNNNNPREAVFATRRGMLLFRQGDVLGSLAEFDKAIELDPRQKAYLWQRGLSLYYLDRFEEGAEQFRIDVVQNPNDTEESIWCFLSEAQLYGVDGARQRFLEVGRDPRPVMRDTYNMFKDGGDPEKLVAAFAHGRENEYFYASLYAGLYYESQKKTEEAKRHIVSACQSPYGQRSDDYMASLAKVHSLCRNWALA